MLSKIYTFSGPWVHSEPKRMSFVADGGKINTETEIKNIHLGTKIADFH